MTGVVTRIERDKGFGFIRDTDGRSRFFNAKDIAFDFDLLRIGYSVSFEPVEGPKEKGNGLRASMITVVEG